MIIGSDNGLVGMLVQQWSESMIFLSTDAYLHHSASMSWIKCIIAYTLVLLPNLLEGDIVLSFCIFVCSFIHHLSYFWGFRAFPDKLLIRIESVFNTLRPGKNGLQFVDDVLKKVFLNEIYDAHCILNQISPMGQVDKPILVHIMTWRRVDDNPLSEPMMACFANAYMCHSASTVVQLPGQANIGTIRHGTGTYRHQTNTNRHSRHQPAHRHHPVPIRKNIRSKKRTRNDNNE